MKYYAWFILVVFLLQTVSAIEVFNANVKDNIAFKIDGVTHIARYYPSAKKVSMLAGTERILIEEDGCAKLGSYNYCVGNVTEGVDDETGDPSSTIPLRVVQAGPDITVERAISDDEPKLNEEITITATIRNTGNERAPNVNYADKFPSSVKVTTSFYDPISNGVLWAGSLDVGKYQTITYTLKFQDYIKYNSTAEASFAFNNKMNRVKSDNELFEVKSPYKLTDSISSASVDLGEDISYNLTINSTTNDQDLSIDSLEMILPAGAMTSNRDMYLESGEGKLTFAGPIKAGTSKQLSFSMKSMKPIQGELVVKMTFIIAGKKFTEELRHKVGMGISDIAPEIKFNPESVKGGKELEIEARIINNGDNKVSGIDLDMTSDIIEPRGWRQLELEPGKKHYGFNKIINAPFIDEDKTFFIKLSGSYKASSGKSMKFNLTKEVTVLAQEIVAELRAVPKIEGDKVNITLFVKNKANFKLEYVSLIDTLPSGFKMIAGSRDADIDAIEAGEEKLAYSYVVTLPTGFAKDSFIVTHTFNAVDDKEEKVMFDKNSEIKIKEDGKPITTETGTNATPLDNATKTQASEEETTKPGVLKRFWNWVKGIFTKEPKVEDKFE